MTSNEELLVLIQAEIDGKVVQQKSLSNWIEFNSRWDSHATYRIKPDEPREWWIALGEFNTGCLADSKKEIMAAARHGDELIKVREVLDDES